MFIIENHAAPNSRGAGVSTDTRWAERAKMEFILFVFYDSTV